MNSRHDELYSQALEHIKTNEGIIETLKTQINNREAAREHPQSQNDIKATERQSLYKLISAMAYDGYGYNPTDKKSPIPKEVSDAVTERCGENIDPDTARKWLKTAASTYPDQALTKTE